MPSPERIAPRARSASTARTPHLILGIYLLTAVAIAVQRTLLSRENNFYILRAASEHLRSGADLYAAYPDLHADFFKYSPTFALLFTPFALLPPTVGYALFASVCALAVWIGVTRLLPPRAASVALAISWISLVGDLQRSQTNALVAGLMVIAWVGFEREWVPGAVKGDTQGEKRRRGGLLGAAIAISTAAFVKIFPLAAAIGAFMRRQWLRFGMTLVGALVVGAALPLIVAPGSLGAQYASWYAIETRDAAPMARYGTGGADLYAGLMGQFRVWFGVDWPHWPTQLAGVIILVLPLILQRRRFAERVFRAEMLASVLVFCVLFNHQAESPSYSIAMIGVAIWFAASERVRWRRWLLWSCVVIVNLMSTDLMPRSLYHAYYVPYLLKTVPLIPAWIVMQLELHGLIANRGASELAEVDALDVSAPEALGNRG